MADLPPSPAAKEHPRHAHPCVLQPLTWLVTAAVNMQLDSWLHSSREALRSRTARFYSAVSDAVRGSSLSPHWPLHPAALQEHTGLHVSRSLATRLFTFGNCGPEGVRGCLLVLLLALASEQSHWAPFPHLLATCMSFLEQCPFRFSVQTGAVFCFCFRVVRIPYILWNVTLDELCNWQIFSPSQHVAFSLLIASFAAQKPFVLYLFI